MTQKRIDPKDIETLEQLRDELKLKAHLFKADVKSEWQKLEHDLGRLKAELKPVQKAAAESALDVAAASQLLFQTVKAGFERIKRSL